MLAFIPRNMPMTLTLVGPSLMKNLNTFCLWETYLDSKVYDKFGQITISIGSQSTENYIPPRPPSSLRYIYLPN